MERRRHFLYNKPCNQENITEMTDRKGWKSDGVIRSEKCEENIYHQIWRQPGRSVKGREFLGRA